MSEGLEEDRQTTPEESEYPDDDYKIVEWIPAAENFPTVGMQKCPLVKREWSKQGESGFP